MKWILKKRKITEQDFENVEKEFGVQFPLDFKGVVLENNGASPEKTTYDTKVAKERIAEYLLSFSKDDKDNIFVAYNATRKYVNEKTIPIMRDSFGNYICFDFSKEKKGELYFWNHEDDSLEYINETFSNFLNSLYD